MTPADKDRIVNAARQYVACLEVREATNERALLRNTLYHRGFARDAYRAAQEAHHVLLLRVREAESE